MRNVIFLPIMGTVNTAPYLQSPNTGGKIRIVAYRRGPTDARNEASGEVSYWTRPRELVIIDGFQADSMEGAI